MDAKPIQRTLVVYSGPLAQACADRLAALLVADGQPGTAVAMMDLVAAADDERVRECLAGLAGTHARTKLADAGWRLDRLDELAVIALIDAREADGRLVDKALESITVCARGMLRVETSGLAAVMAPEIDEAEAIGRMHALSRLPRLDRGLIVVSRVTCDGFRLDDDTALIEQTARALHLIITSPLRDQVEPADVHAPLSVGASWWRWPGNEVAQRLVRRWACAAVAAWLSQPDDASDAGTSEFSFVQALLEREGLSPEQLARLIRPMAPLSSFPAWSPPQPWRMGPALHRLDSLLTALSIPVAEMAALAADGLDGFWMEREANLRFLLRAEVDQFPVSGMARVQGRVAALRAAAVALRDAAEERLEREDALAADLNARQTALMEEVEKLAGDWPGDEPRLWLPFTLKPWRWMGLAGRYQALHRCGKDLRELVVERAALEQEQLVTAALVSGYTEWERRVGAIGSDVEEVVDFLSSLFCEWPDDDATGVLEPDWEAWISEELYDELTEGDGLEATRAAVAVGGLGRNIGRPDDDLGQKLVEAGRARMDGVEGWSAIEAIRRRWRSADASARWWTDRWAAAAPLWPANALADTEPDGEGTRTTFLLASEPVDLPESVEEKELAAARWFEIVERQTVVVVRLLRGVQLALEEK